MNPSPKGTGLSNTERLADMSAGMGGDESVRDPVEQAPRP